MAEEISSSIKCNLIAFSWISNVEIQEIASFLKTTENVARQAEPQWKRDFWGLGHCWCYGHFLGPVTGPSQAGKWWRNRCSRHIIIPMFYGSVFKDDKVSYGSSARNGLSLFVGQTWKIFFSQSSFVIISLF